VGCEGIAPGKSGRLCRHDPTVFQNENAIRNAENTDIMGNYEDSRGAASGQIA
jgi:hypothetical protein